MGRQSRANMVLGILLILVGGIFLIGQFFPGLLDWIQIEFSWPLLIIGGGLLLLVFGLLAGETGMAVPAAIVGGIGCLLYYQNSTGNWSSWAYAWTLIPGFVGVGVLLDGLLSGKFRQALGGGGTLIVISAVMFVIFGSFLGGPVSLGLYWPVLLIVIGLWILVSALFRRRE